MKPFCAENEQQFNSQTFSGTHCSYFWLVLGLKCKKKNGRNQTFESHCMKIHLRKMFWWNVSTRGHQLPQMSILKSALGICAVCRWRRAGGRVSWMAKVGCSPPISPKRSCLRTTGPPPTLPPRRRSRTAPATVRLSQSRRRGWQPVW